MKKIFKAVIRDIWHYHWRSIITFVAIFAVIVFPIAMFSVSPNIGDSINDNNENYKLAHLDLRFSNGNESLVQLINESIDESLGRYPEIIETRFLGRGKAKIGGENGTWEAAQLVGIPKSVNQSINQFSIVSGNTTIGDNEIFVIESFAEAYSLSIGSNITILIGPSKVNLTIAGLVRSLEYLSYDINQECIVYLDDELLHDLYGIPQFIINSIAIYFWKEITVDEISQSAIDIQEVFDSEGIILFYQWLTREVSFSAILSNALELASSYLNTSALIIIVIVGIVIFIITKRYALEQRKQTGTLFAFGFSPSTILRAFLLRSFLISLIAMVFGVLGGYGVLRIITKILIDQWGLISVVPSLSPITVLVILSSSLVMTIFFTYLAARSNVNLTPYEALRGKVKGYSGTRLKFMSKWRNAFKYPIRNLFRNKSRSILTFLAYAGSVMLAFSLIVAQASIFTTTDVYFSEQVDWDVKAIFNLGFNTTTYSSLSNFTGIEEVEPYLETFVQSEDNLEGLVFLRGIAANSNMSKIDLQEGNLFTNSTAQEIIMSKYVAEQL
jgi:ABC-type antimicrobial peptide transport system permease subunit